jgi:hypothetical protein
VLVDYQRTISGCARPAIPAALGIAMAVMTAVMMAVMTAVNRRKNQRSIEAGGKRNYAREAQYRVN